MSGIAANRCSDAVVDVLCEEVLEIFLVTARELGFAKLGEDQLLEFLEADFAGLDLGSETGVVGGVAVGYGFLELSFGKDLAGDLEREGVGIEAADVCVEEILEIRGGAAELGVEVEAARAEAACAQDGNHGAGELAGVGVELVGIPAQERIARVGIDRTEHAGCGGNLDLMLEGVTCKRGVVGLDVELEVLVETVGMEESDTGGAVEIVLVLCGLLRLGLDEELALEADILCIIDSHLEEGGQMVLLTSEIGVDQ